jgi:hypothetical protein
MDFETLEAILFIYFWDKALEGIALQHFIELLAQRLCRS